MASGGDIPTDRTQGSAVESPARAMASMGPWTCPSCRPSSRCWPSWPGRCRPPGGVVYEPKWDGFRCIVFRDGDEVEHRQPQREAADPVLPRAGRRPAGRPARAVRARRRDRDRHAGRARLRGPAAQRIHPAESRIKMLAETSAGLVRGLRPAGPGRRRPAGPAVRRAPGRCWSRRWPARRRPSTSPPPPPTRAVAEEWFDRFEGAGLDGVVAKPVAPHLPGGRAGDAQGEARTAPPTAWSPASAGTRTAPASARCSSGSTTTDGHAAPRRRGRRVHRGPAQGAGRRAGALPGRRPRRPPVGRVGRVR